MFLKIKKLEVVPDQWSSHLVITMVGLYGDDDKWVKHTDALKEHVAEILTEVKIPYDPTNTL